MKMDLNSLARTLAERDFISKRTQAMAEAVIREAIEKTLEIAEHAVQMAADKVIASAIIHQAIRSLKQSNSGMEVRNG